MLSSRGGGERIITFNPSPCQKIPNVGLKNRHSSSSTSSGSGISLEYHHHPFVLRPVESTGLVTDEDDEDDDGPITTTALQADSD